MSENLVKQESAITRREWILRYATPFKSLMFMAGPMILIMVVNSLFVMVDKQLTINFAIDEIIAKLEGNIQFYIIGANDGIINQNLDLTNIAKQLINVSTQYSNTVIMVTTALSLFTSVGTSIKFGQAMGRRNKQEMDNAVVTGFIQTLFLIVIATIALNFLYPLMITTQAGISDPAKSLQYQLSSEYVSLFVLTFGLLTLANFLSTLIRTEGKVWFVIWINVIGVVINTVAGIIYMDVFHMGMKGAVMSSITAWIFMIVASVIYIWIQKDSLLRINLKTYKFKWNDAGSIWLNGLSPMLGNLIFAIVSFTSTILISNIRDLPEMVSQAQLEELTKRYILIFDAESFVPFKEAMINNGSATLNPTEHISLTIIILSSAFPWLNIIYAPLVGCMQGATITYSYNEGAQKRERMIKMFKMQFILSIIWMTFAWIMVLALSKQMIQLFSGPVDLHWWLFAYLAFMPLAGFTFTVIGYFQGSGNAKLALITNVSRSLIFEISFIFMGWAVAKGASTDGSRDWLFFLCNSFKEIPAALVAFIAFTVNYKKGKKNNYFIDQPDKFESPTYKQACLNVLQINKDFFINYYDHKIALTTDQNKIAKLTNAKLAHIYKYDLKMINKTKELDAKEILHSLKGNKNWRSDPNNQLVQLYKTIQHQEMDVVRERYVNSKIEDDKKVQLIELKHKKLVNKYDKLIKRIIT
ncbi:MATE family efflux transporter [Spiroplasma culicicola]|uniref:MATE efflux family protein n=1 Tax=Spiroplasma culicicola AES-1 TaxID=1276246 RepID=W6A7H4_9MOLU|nr:MATE family efflux transporter [Spiroplasma culicicola]AHI52937.1 MATE efflux family protein [Spiroplasma culicicola AES-1]